MKLFYSFFTLLFISNLSVSQWQATQSSLISNETVYDIVEHKGELFGAINSKGLVRYNGISWDSVPASGFTFNANSIHIERIASNDNFLYTVVQNQSCASSMIYKSTDSGVTFIPDTAGLPKYNCNNEIETISYIYSLNDYIVVVLNRGTYFKKPTDASWIANVNPSTQFAEFWEEYNNKWYAWYNYKLHVSSDKGITWNTPTNTNIPNYYLAKVVNVDQSTGRIYLAGRIITTSQPKMFYSDNEGVTWDSVAINQFLTLDWIGNKQQILGMVSQGNFIQLNVVNNSNGSHPDVLVSNDGGNSFTIDTAGLPANSFGTVASRKMLLYDNNVFMALNYNDIYKKSIGGSTSIREDINTNEYTIYPNPTNDFIRINKLNYGDKIELIDINGKVLFNGTNNTLNLSLYPEGLYYIRITTNSNIFIKKIVKQ